MTSNLGSQGSIWNRWDPHIHAPGTVLNDGFGGEGAWEEFLGRIERSNPVIRALGITDYLSLDLYERVVTAKRSGRLTQVNLIFPNVEIRFGIGTGKGAAVNGHLLISPEDKNHVDEARRFLLGLTFNALGDSFRCSRSDLIRLGHAFDKQVSNDEKALEIGTNQFKVNFDQLKAEWKLNDWAQHNILLAVAGGSNDGTSGLSPDSSFAALRKEIERSSHIVFSSQKKQRDFWLGYGAATKAQLEEIWGGPKPCLHGSDAHELEKIGAPDQNRLCWIKGDATFESLRQACIEPEGRTFIGPAPPRGALPSQVISSVHVTNGGWFTNGSIPLNPGLIAIIGARGSGKTALADIIAAGGFSLAPHLNERSFIHRAKPYLGNTSVTLRWESGEPTGNQLLEAEYDELFQTPRVRYLSQQFVDALCSAEGVTDELLLEIERVIFQAHQPDERMGTTDFRELLDFRASRARTARINHQQALDDMSQRLIEERERKASLPALKYHRSEKVKSIEKDKSDRTALIGNGSEQRSKQLNDVLSAAEEIRSQVEQARRRHQILIALRDRVAEIRKSEAPLRLHQLRENYRDAALSSDEWKNFQTDFVGDVDSLLAAQIKDADERTSKLTGPKSISPQASSSPLDKSLLPAGGKLSEQPLDLLDRETDRLRKLIGIDAEKAKKFKQLTEKMSRDEAAIAKLDRDIEAANQAEGNIKELIEERRKHHRLIFEAIIEEENELRELYAPLKARLQQEPGTLGKLSFEVRRSADVRAWAREGEKLLDLRKAGAFRGEGALLKTAQAELSTAWEEGSAADIANAMASFREKHEPDLLTHAPVQTSDKEAFRKWAESVGTWLYATNHIKISYGVQYDGVDIERLSPGTRGIVLLLLYLTIDNDDDRPLLIDQPEENLDPKSVADELVGRFRAAKLRRQIIIVTHNANLVVNADADQVIVAKCGPHQAGTLPEISYVTGGLESETIRQQVCEILEGGETAFKERARRLRIGI